MTHSHNYKYATFNRESAAQVNSALKETRELLQEVRRVGREEGRKGGMEREREREGGRGEGERERDTCVGVILIM